MPVGDAGDRLERQLRPEVLEAGDSAEEERQVVEAERRRLVGDAADEPDGGALEPVRVLPRDQEEDAERVYGLLADGGEIFMNMEKTPFANRFAMLRDRFGASWMLLHQPEST